MDNLPIIIALGTVFFLVFFVILPNKGSKNE